LASSYQRSSGEGWEFDEFDKGRERTTKYVVMMWPDTSEKKRGLRTPVYQCAHVVRTTARTAEVFYIKPSRRSSQAQVQQRTALHAYIVIYMDL
jgi:hypothetical protein